MMNHDIRYVYNRFICNKCQHVHGISPALKNCWIWDRLECFLATGHSQLFGIPRIPPGCHQSWYVERTPFSNRPRGHSVGHVLHFNILIQMLLG